MEFMYFAFLFLMIFGNKFGYIDVTSLAGILGLLFILVKPSISVPKYSIPILFFAVGVFVVSSFSYIFSPNSDLYVILRIIRFLVNSLSIIVVIYNFPVTNRKKINILILVLLIHVIVLDLQILFPEVQIVFSDIYGFDKKIRGLRAFGLTAGYDTAGLMVCIGIVINYFSLYYYKKSKYVFLILFFIIAVFFTSRTTILISFILLFYLVNRYKIKNNQYIYALSKSIAVICFIAISTILISTFDTNINTLNINLLDNLGRSISYNYSYVNPIGVLKSMLIIPEGTLQILFGSSQTSMSDIGYIKLIHMIGFVGSILVFFIYFYIWIVSMRIWTKLDDRNLDYELYQTTKITVDSISVIIPLIFIFNFKNLYLLTRTISETTLILFIMLLVCFSESIKVSPKTDPEVMLGSDLRGGREDDKYQTLLTRTDHC